MEKVLGDVNLISKNGNSVHSSTLNEKQIVGLYFSAHWCPPCRGFTPVLAEAYKTIVAAGKSFEVIFISSDQNESQFKQYYAEMPWMCLPFSAREDKERISDAYGVSGIPCLVLLDGATGKLISKDGRAIIMQDQKGDQFPWENFSAGGKGGCILM
jgi:nucleoredoxin